MKIEQHELRSSLWRRLQAHYEAQLELLRRKNDGDMTPEQTQRLRGRIAQVKEFLALATEPDIGAPTDKAGATLETTGLGF